MRYIYVFRDGIHPNAIGEHKIAGLWNSVLIPLIQDKLAGYTFHVWYVLLRVVGNAPYDRLPKAFKSGHWDDLTDQEKWF